MINLDIIPTYLVIVKNNIIKINRHVRNLVNIVLDKFIDEINKAIIIENAIEFIEKNDNYEIEMAIPGIIDKNEEKYDLAILHQLPDARNTFSTEIQALINNETSILYILGSRTNLNRFNSNNRTINIKPLRNQKDNVFVSLNSNFSLFNISESSIE